MIRSVIHSTLKTVTEYRTMDLKRILDATTDMRISDTRIRINIYQSKRLEDLEQLSENVISLNTNRIVQ
jgi:hypothetical protein